MSIVYVGCAAIDEHGNAVGGTAGDQTGREVRIQNWYKHEKGWVVIRAKDPNARARLALAMRLACNNPAIGYDQSQRDSLYNAAKPHRFNPGLVTVKCETDCSALVRVCCAYATIMAPNFRTVNEPTILKNTGKFTILTDPAYTDHPDRLLAGDILCTPVSGHTVVVLNDGELAHVPKPAPAPKPEDMPLLKLKLFHMKGSAVKLLQTELLKWNPKCLPKYGADGDFGKETDAAVRAYQKVHKDSAGKPLVVDGEVGLKTWTSLLGN